MFEFANFFQTYLPQHFLKCLNSRLIQDGLFTLDSHGNIFTHICDFFIPFNLESKILNIMDNHFKLQKVDMFQSISKIDSSHQSKIMNILTTKITLVNRFYYDIMFVMLKALYTSNLRTIKKSERQKIIMQMEQSFKSFQFQLGFSMTHDSPWELLILLLDLVQRETINQNFKKFLLQFAHSIQANSNVILKIQSIKITQKIQNDLLSTPVKNTSKTLRTLDASTSNINRDINYQTSLIDQNRSSNNFDLKSQNSRFSDKNFDQKQVWRCKKKRSIKAKESQNLILNKQRSENSPFIQKRQLKCLGSLDTISKKLQQRLTLRSGTQRTPQKISNNLESYKKNLHSKQKFNTNNPQNSESSKKAFKKILQAKKHLQSMSQMNKFDRTLYSVRSLKIAPKKSIYIPSSMNSLGGQVQYQEPYFNSNTLTRTASNYFQPRQLEVLVEDTPRPRKKVKLESSKMLKEILF